MSGTAPYSTQAFPPLPGRCFRLVSSGEGGSPTTARTRPSGGAPSLP
jgi:ureidoglycolate hydrolase